MKIDVNYWGFFSDYNYVISINISEMRNGVLNGFSQELHKRFGSTREREVLFPSRNINDKNINDNINDKNISDERARVNPTFLPRWSRR